MERLDALKADFDELMRMVRRTKDPKERRILLKQATDIIANVDEMVRESQIRLEQMKERLRIRQR